MRGTILSALITVLALSIYDLPFWPFTIGTHHPLEPLLLAIIFGIILGNTLPAKFKTGHQFAAKKFLPLGIILLGASINTNDISAITLPALGINITCVAIAFLVTIYLCRLFKVSKKLGILIGIGTAICGGSAIVVAAPVIKADETETTLSITIITLFGILAIFIFPALGKLLELSDTAFGIWAGTSIQAVAQVIAAGFAYSETAGNISTIVKLVRILLLAPMIVILSLTFHNKQKQSWTTYIPPFIIGFIVLLCLNIANLIPSSPMISHTASFFITTGLAAIGLNTKIKPLIKQSPIPLAIGFASATILACVSLALILWLL